jgi:hypothetical protein
MLSSSGISLTLTRGDPSSPLGDEPQHLVPRSTLQVIARLFPPPTLGQIFTARFIDRASTERCILPDLGKEDIVVCTKSIATLAQALDLSYDTTQKYVVLFKALGILHKRKFMGQLAFVLSLGIYQSPHTLEANLDYLLQSLLKTHRNKFYQLVVEVKQRCYVYGLITQEFTTALGQLHTLVSAQPGETKRRLEQRLAHARVLMSLLLTQVHSTHLSPTGVDSGQALLPSHSHTSSAEQNGQERLLPHESIQSGGYDGALSQRENLPVREEQEERAAQQLRHDMPTSSQTGSIGRFHERVGTPNLPLRQTLVDSSIQSRTSASTTVPAQDRLHDEHLSSSLPALVQQVDSRRIPQELPSTHSDQQGGFAATQEPENLSQEPSEVDSRASLRNVNVIAITEFFFTFTLRNPAVSRNFWRNSLSKTNASTRNTKNSSAFKRPCLAPPRRLLPPLFARRCASCGMGGRFTIQVDSLPHAAASSMRAFHGRSRNGLSSMGRSPLHPSPRRSRLKDQPERQRGGLPLRCLQPQNPRPCRSNLR